MPITFGSVGDIISASLLVKDLLLALDSSRGSSAEYQAVVRELYILDTALLQRTATPDIHALYEIAKQTVVKCRESVDLFINRVKKYISSHATGGSGNIIKDIARKIQWRSSQKEVEIARFRRQLWLLSLHQHVPRNRSNARNSQCIAFTDSGWRTQASLDTHTQALNEFRARLDDSKQLISAGNSLGSRMMERLDWIQKLGSDLKRFLRHVIAGNIAIYQEVVALRSAFAKQVDRPLLEDPFILEDAIGCIAPVHLRFINYWAALQAVMEIRFQGKQGLMKICKKEYVLQESATGKEVDPSLNLEDGFLPGQKVAMSLVFKRETAEQPTQTSTHCPRCHAVTKQPADLDVLL
ncbi:hypothetical protein K469DRAFT_597803 [Zopfia rhizophila CBS 207.26]|uniref:Ubiquitin-like domain-containing protein n=1 Tax=Zopfia rhizophila CBS 207.26 TaxID=1314779 RepID=A0A6A6DIE0_9PEZI|nr:hypothetical protein K469DRAFT_597803 [Zopfia rhizophila CBS 207.26]